MILLDICICCILFLLGYNIKNFFRDFSTEDRKVLTYLFFYHFLVAIVFHFYILEFGGDATNYWFFPKNMSLSEIMGLIENKSASGVLFLINYVPSKILGLSFFTGNMIYALVGYIGFVYIYRITGALIKNTPALADSKIANIPLYPWIWFLPNLHFWSSGVGKDTILFFCIILFLYGVQKSSKRIPIIILTLLLSLGIRPHITLLLLTGIAAGYVLDRNFKILKKAFVLILFGVAFIWIFDYVIRFVQLESLEANVVEEYTASRAAALNQDRTGSGVDIASYSFPVKIFTFLYRPLFFDINGIFAAIVSVENLFYLLFTIKILRSNIINGFKKANYLVKGVFIYFIMSTVAFSLTLGNLGIMLRQKNQLMPVFILFGLCVLSMNLNKMKPDKTVSVK